MSRAFDESAERQSPVVSATAEDDLGYELLRGGPEVNDSEIELPETEAVEVSVMWGRNIMTTRHVARGESFYVGEAAGNDHAVDFFLPSEKLGTTRMPVVLSGPTGFRVVVPGTARGRIVRKGEPGVSLDEARREGTPCHELSGALEWPLPVHAEVELRLQDVTLRLRSVRAGKPIPRALVHDIDWGTAAYFGASFLSVGSLLSLMAFLTPPLGVTDGEVSVNDQAMLILQLLNDAKAEREEEPKETPTADPNQQNEGGTGERARDAEGAMGERETTAQNRRYAVKGDPDDPDPHLARSQALHEAATFGIVGLLSSDVAGDPNAPTAPWGRDTSSGLDALSAMGNMWGDEIGQAQGAGGLGLSGLGEGAGGTGMGIGLGTIGTFGHGSGTGTEQGFGAGHGRLQGTHSATTPKMRIGNPTVSGRLPPQVIQRIVRQNFGRFRLCYEKGLAGNPNLEGRVAVRFVIDRGGAVSNAANGGSSLPSSEVADCVIRAFYGLSFPKPEGGIVTVSYPLSFSPG